jgi:hypothetical protein
LTQYYPKHRLQALPSSAVSTTGKPEVQLKYDATLVQKWQDDGYVVLPQFYSEADTDAAKPRLRTRGRTGRRAWLSTISTRTSA